MQTARLQKILLLLSPALSSLCLAIGYQQFGAWAALVGLFTFLFWLAARRWKTLWMASLGLAAAVTAAVYGLAHGAALIWMLPGAALALASWDLTLLDARLANHPPGATLDALIKTHYAVLLPALGLGLLVVALGQLIRFQIPFFFMLVLVALAYFSLNRLLRSLAA